MVRFSNILAAYFVVGALLWAGGAIQWGQTGVAGLIVDTPEEGVEVNNETADQLQQRGGPIQEAAGALGASPILAVWNLLVGLIGYLFWPITVLQGVNAPPRIVVLLGGTPTVLFYGSFIRLIRTSA
jgi:hypothetical protein